MSISRLRYWSAHIVAAVATSFCGVIEPAQAVPFFVNASGNVSGAACCAPNHNDQLVSLYNDTADTGALIQTSTSVQLFNSRTFGPNFADASLSGTATVGTLRAAAAVNTGVSAAPTALQGANSIAGTPGTLATSTVDVAWGDTITVGGNGPLGSPVDFVARLRLTVGALSSSFSNGTVFGGEPGADAEIVSTIDIHPPGGGVLTLRAEDCFHLNIPGCLSPGVNLEFSDSLTLHLHVGDTFTVVGDIFIDTSAFNGANAFVNASDTALFTLDPVTAGAVYITASGVSFLTPAAPSPVSQPATLYLLGTALAGILAVSRRARLG